jgi:hypothetical protein
MGETYRDPEKTKNWINPEIESFAGTICSALVFLSGACPSATGRPRIISFIDD